jgi:NNP family nitrate/nitrite transporter-like MFS transporter
MDMLTRNLLVEIGIVSGTVGAFGNLGGVIFNIVFRYNGIHYDRSIWIMGVITLGVAVLQSWTRPVAKGHVITGRS